jgi:GDSL-like Lipase/Acylhydrolase family
VADRWLEQNPSRRAGVYIAANMGLIVALLAATRLESIWWFLGAALLALVVSIILHRKLRPDLGEHEGRWASIGIGLLVVGGGFLFSWAGGGADWQGLLGLTASVFGYGIVVRYARSVAGRGEHGAVRLLTIGSVLSLIGVARVFILIPSGEAPVSWMSIIIGAVVAIAGFALISEGVLVLLGNHPAAWARLMLIVGAAVFCGVLTWLGWHEVRSWWLLAIAGVTMIGVGSVVADADYDAAGMVVVAVFFWALSPATTAAPAVAPGDDRPVMVAIGDSYISGEGASRFYRGTNIRPREAEGSALRRNECRRAPTAYPLLLAGDDWRLVTVACSAARISHVDRLAQYPGEPSLADTPVGLAQLDHVDRLLSDVPGNVELVLVSIGGNDAGFGEIGPTCIAPGDCTAVAQIWLDELAPLEERLEVIYTTIKDQYGGQTPIVVVPYPGPISPASCSTSTLTAAEHRFLAGFTTELQGVIRAAAASAGVHHLAQVERALEEQKMRICDGGEHGVNYIGLNPTDTDGLEGLDPTTWFHNSLHPNERGHAELARVIAGNLPAVPNPPPVPTDYHIRSLAGLVGADSVATCDAPECADPGGWRVAQMRSGLAQAVWRGALLAAGAWMIWLGGISLYRRPRPTEPVAPVEVAERVPADA